MRFEANSVGQTSRNARAGHHPAVREVPSVVAQVGRGRPNTGRWSPGGRRGSNAAWGLLRACLPPKAPILVPDCHHPAREVPLVGSRWAVDGRTPPGGPPVAARAFERRLGLLRALVVCPGWAPPGGAVRRLRGSVEQLGRGRMAGKGALTWGSSAVGPESGTIDLASTYGWANDR